MILTNAILGISFTAGVLGTSEYRIPDHERVDNQNFSRFLFKLEHFLLINFFFFNY